MRLPAYYPHRCILFLLVLFTQAAVAHALPTDSLKRATPPAPAPFSGDDTWMNGQNRMTKSGILLGDSSSPVTFTAYFDAYYDHSFNHPSDHTITGSTSIGRDAEFVPNLASIGFNIELQHVLATLEFQFGNSLTLISDGDQSFGHGRNLDAGSLRNIREATGGYHFDNVGYGLNIEAGVFQAFTGLESYLLQENWNYQRSFVGDYVPGYLTGIRVTYYPRLDLSTSFWLFNGWSTFGVITNGLGIGSSTTYRPRESVSYILNAYLGRDTKNVVGRNRLHVDGSLLWRYRDSPRAYGISKMALSLNAHAGFETGGVDPVTGAPLPGADSAHMFGAALANRIWFDHNKYALTLRVDALYDPLRYFTVPPLPIGFLPEVGPIKNELLWGVTVTYDIMPTENLTIRTEFTSRHSNIPFFAGANGTTSSDGWVGTSGSFTPDLVQNETRLTAAILVRL